MGKRTPKSSENKETKENLHVRHRERMRKKVLEVPHSMTDCEIVEMLLYLALSRGNTNEQAHMLLQKSGKRLRGLLELDDAQIRSIDGLGDAAVAAISTLREFFVRMEKEKLDVKKEKKITKDNVAQKLHKLFYGKTEEEMIMITTDTNCRMINVHTLSKGTTAATVVPIKKLVKMAIDDKATYAIIAHNHPNGMLVPSNEDIEITKLICEALAMIDVAVIEHYIVTKTSILGIMSVK